MRSDPRPLNSQPGNRVLLVLVAVVLVAALAGAAWWFTRSAEPTAELVAVAPSATPAIPPAAAPIQHPIEQVLAVPPSEPAIPLPALADSDPLLFEALSALLGDAGWRSLLAGDFLIQRMVATIDNLPRSKLAPHLLPVRSAPGALQVDGVGAARTIAATNAARYDAYIEVLDRVDPQRLVALYVRLYPLFQQAYRETGQPEGYFNDRLVAVIDHLLAAPTPSAAVLLVRPKVFWEFADPALEQASAGEKLMIRIGPEHAATVRARLSAIRALLVAAPPAN